MVNLVGVFVVALGVVLIIIGLRGTQNQVWQSLSKG